MFVTMTRKQFGCLGTHAVCTDGTEGISGVLKEHSGLRVAVVSSKDKLQLARKGSPPHFSLYVCIQHAFPECECQPGTLQSTRGTKMAWTQAWPPRDPHCTAGTGLAPAGCKLVIMVMIPTVFSEHSGWARELTEAGGRSRTSAQ